MPEVDQDLITEIVDAQMRNYQVGTIYIRPMFELMAENHDENELGSDSAKWPEPWGMHDLGNW